MRHQRNGGQRRRSGSRASADPSLFIGPSEDDPTSPADAGGDDDFFRPSGSRKADQKARQLCRQVYRTLCVALPGCGDAVLQDLTVVSVDPAPDAGHLLVTVVPGTEPAATADVYGRLARAAGRLRAEVARDIVRKRAPELGFRVLPRAGTGSGVTV